VNNIRDLFSSKRVVAFELNKSDINAKENALHLDCCFQPIGKNMAIIYEGGFKNNNDIVFLNNLFGKENLINISKDEMYNMHSNIFSISDNVIVSEKSFDRLNSILRKKGFIVEMINFSQIAKMEGLLRCSTLPLNRL
jgi:N-dimethylarginine dimethylaminohydrolase